MSHTKILPYEPVLEVETFKYRVWPDGTAQDADESPYSHMSDDFRIVDAPDEDAASLLGNPPCMKLNGDRTVAVALDVFWNEDMAACPRGCKVQLLGAGGVAMYGTYNGKDEFFKKWAPVPRNRS